MKFPIALRCLALGSILLLAACAAKKGQTPEVVVLIPQGSAYTADLEPIDFVKDIKPILEAKCIACHFDKSPATNISFQTREQILDQTSPQRPILIPGDPEHSTLFLVTTLPEYFIEAMPASGHRLNEVETWKIYQWILEGAKWPKDAKLLRKTDGRITDVL